MQLGRDSAYGVFAVVQLATEGKGSSISAEHLAEVSGIPLESLDLIFTNLMTAEIVRHEVGSSKRFTLTRAPDEITLLEIVEAIEGQAEPDIVLPVDPAMADATGSHDRGAASSPPPRPRTAPASNIGPDWSGTHTLRTVTSLASALLGGSTIADLVADDPSA